MNSNGHEEFRWDTVSVDKPFMDRRLIGFCRSGMLQLLAEGLAARGWDIAGLKYIEIGCGTGTVGLAMAMLGAEVTLVDFDEKALAVARKAFALYSCAARFVKADVLSEPPADLAGGFDIVVSGGLIEHFTGEDRVKVMAYHRQLLREKGFALIGVPNRLSPFYRACRAVSTLLGQWTIETELPFTAGELRDKGGKAGFGRSTVWGAQSLRRDALVHAFALIAMVLRLFPGKLRERIARSRLRSRLKKMELNDAIPEKDVAEHVRDSFAAAVKNARYTKRRQGLKDRLSSGLLYLGERTDFQASDSDAVQR